VFVYGIRREPGDGLRRSLFDGHHATAAPVLGITVLPVVGPPGVS